MGVLSTILAASPLLVLGNCHAVITNAQGIQGSPASVGFQVDPAIARNCISINPCQQDSTIIRDAEIKANIVNTCGRTELKGNIDVGENTENALASQAVTQVKAGSEVTVTLHQVNADGAGPYVCDIDMTSNAGVKFTNLTVLNNVPGANGLSQAKTQAFNLTVQMPNNLDCSGASTGNVCTVRCRNNAVAGPFGGCFAVQQVDNRKTVNSPAQIDTAQSFTNVQEQVVKNQADFQDAVKANEISGSDEAAQNLAAVNALLKESVVTKPAPQQTPTVINEDGNQGGNNRGGNRGGNQGGNRGGNRGGNQGGNRGGNRGGNQGGNRGGNRGGNQGGNRGGNRGGNQGGNRGGNQGENKAGANRSRNGGSTDGGNRNGNGGVKN
ncbi:hypothetical protein EsDP_00000809 [Epichloe bromicola]|uniref:GEgh 16 protein n=1 Tax=Epichloe bromicola TaxID=79588 RepID=A0ABQ0CG26_9HYPO